MKHYIYSDTNILNSYISQIYDGVLKGKKTENKKETLNEDTINSPKEKITSTIDGGIPAVIKGTIQANYERENKQEKFSDVSVASEVIETIFHDNLLDYLLEYLDEQEILKSKVEDFSQGDFIKVKIPFRFINNDYLKSISSQKFKEAFMKINNTFSGGTSQEDKDMKKSIELINNFSIIIEQLLPTEHLVISEDMIVPLIKEYFREKPELIDFKYSGDIILIGKITGKDNKDVIIDGFLNKDFSKALNEVKKEMYNLLLPNYQKSLIVAPVALYFE